LFCKGTKQCNSLLLQGHLQVAINEPKLSIKILSMNNKTIHMFRKLLAPVLVCASLSILFSQCGTARQADGNKPASGTTAQMPDYNRRKMLLRDEGLGQLAYVDLANPRKNWFVKVPAGRDIQLVGSGRVLIGTGKGYEEREIATGNKVNELTSYEGTVGATRLKNGNTLLTGLNWQGKQGIVLIELDNAGNIKRTINYTGFPYVRLVRQTVTNTFLLVANDSVFEGNAAGNIIWRAKIKGPENPHAWQAARLTNGQTIVAGGYAANFQLFDAAGNAVKTITGPADVNPSFFAGFQTLPNGNYVVANWQGHGPTFGGSGHQVLEYSPNGELVWSWKQDATKFSSIQGVIVLDGLDINKLYVEGGGGVLEPVK
jgi:hypothetical protein